MGEVPSYDELLTPRERRAPGAAWHVFGAGDQLGTLNFLTRERVARAATLVRTGKVINLDYPVNAFEPYPSGTRHRARHHLFANNEFHRDDYLDGLYLQGTSQLDSLRHIGHPHYGFYGGLAPSQVTSETELLGIHHFAQHGIVGRGILLDVARYLADRGAPLSLYRNDRIITETLDATARQQDVQVMPGDMVLIRTGWAGQYLALNQAQRVEYNKNRTCAGLAQERQTVRWLWDHQVAVVAADNLGVEESPRHGGIDDDFELPGQAKPDRGVDHNGMLHRPLIPLLGMPMGELWALDDLAADCADDHVYEFMVVCKPLNVIGGAGSPANATAIK